MAERIICAGRPHDHEGGQTGQPHGLRYHLGCAVCDGCADLRWGRECDLPHPGVDEHRDKHARALVQDARAAGWALGPEAADGTYPHAMCRSCRRPEAGMAALLRQMLIPAPDTEEGTPAGEQEPPLWSWVGQTVAATRVTVWSHWPALTSVMNCAHSAAV